MKANFFVKPYLYTNKEDRLGHLENIIHKWQYQVEFKNLQMSFTEYFNLPLPLMNIIDKGCEEIHKIKMDNIKSMKQK